MLRIVKAENNILEFKAKVSKNGYYTIQYKFAVNLRSAEQNKYYWVAVIPFLKEFFSSMGITMNSEEAHTNFKEMAGLYQIKHTIDLEASAKYNKQIFKEIKIYDSFSNAGDISVVKFMNSIDIVRHAIIEYSNGMFVLPEPLKQ